MRNIFIAALLLIASAAQLALANSTTGRDQSQEFLVKFTKQGIQKQSRTMSNFLLNGAIVKPMAIDGWVTVTVKTAEQAKQVQALKNNPFVAVVQPNYKIQLPEQYLNLKSKMGGATLERLKSLLASRPDDSKPADNPPIPPLKASTTTGTDPDLSKQWGMLDLNVQSTWNQKLSDKQIIVAVIDTGVDYTHEDLAEQMWRNPGEIADNQIDDDKNGFVDDIVGWDFASNDNKPYDYITTARETILNAMSGVGGNPGHGTHCAGNVAAKADNGIGVVGVAGHANVKIMALRFLSETGSGSTSGAVSAIRYAVDNGARVLSNSWGSIGEDPSDAAGNQALKDAIQYAKDHGVLFVAAAGNGDQNGNGYDNDSSATPGIPASYNYDNIVSVAAIDINNQLGSFSNWGKKTVHIAAPGVKVFGSMVNNNYSDVAFDFTQVKKEFPELGDQIPDQAYWDGTSMATPHVAGAAGLYLAKHPDATYAQVKQALITSAIPVPALQGKVVSDGKLNVGKLLDQ